MSYADEEYNGLVKSILSEGEHRMDRTGTGIIGKFTHTMSFDLTKGFPLLTTKRVYWDGCVSELLWFLRGQTNVNDLPKKVQQWWWPWADNDGDLGPIYGANWRNFGGDIDQLARLLNDLRQDPFSRRHVITLWDPATVHMANLPPCHGTVIQFYVHRNEGGQMGLSCQMYQRSADAFLGVPVNIASYALLTHLVAHDLGFTPTRLVHVIGDAHIYENHLAAVETQQSRQGMEAPQLVINPSMPPLLDAIQNPNFASYLTLLNYNPHPSIKAPLAV